MTEPTVPSEFSAWSRLREAEREATLRRAAQAVRLLGATAVRTGVRPTIARTFIDLGDLHTRASMQDGITVAAALTAT